jgi:hypothetical protein
MMAPLHFAYLDLLVSRNSFECLQNLDGVLLIRKILFSISVFHGYFLFRHSQTFLQLRHMEHVMHVRQLWWQPQLISYFTSPLQNHERSNEPRCEFASYLESVQTSHRGHLEVNKISNFKVWFSSPMIGVAFLP